MKARAALEGASYDPDTLAAIYEAFDQAWAVIAPLYPTELEKQHARLILANSTLAVASVCGTEVEVLKRVALRYMSLDPRAATFDDPAVWEKHAQETRKLAAEECDPDKRRTLHEIAVCYDKLANLVASRRSLH